MMRLTFGKLITTFNDFTSKGKFKKKSDSINFPRIPSRTTDDHLLNVRNNPVNEYTEEGKGS